MPKYILSYGERSEGHICNQDYSKLVESDEIPTIELLRKNGLINDGYCTNMSHPGCEDCSGSHIENFVAEEFSKEKAEKLGLTELVRLK